MRGIGVRHLRPHRPQDSTPSARAGHACDHGTARARARTRAQGEGEGKGKGTGKGKGKGKGTGKTRARAGARHLVEDLEDAEGRGPAQRAPLGRAQCPRAGVARLEPSLRLYKLYSWHKVTAHIVMARIVRSRCLVPSMACMLKRQH